MPAVVITARAFDGAKARLAPALPPEARARLAEALLADVLDAVLPQGWPVTVVTCDDRAAALAELAGAAVLRDPGEGQSHAAGLGLAHARAGGATDVLVMCADLPLLEPESFGWFARELRGLGAGTVGLCPALGRGGTNAVWLPAGSDFTFAFGADSLPLHREEARRRGLGPVEVRCAPVEADLDVPDDLRAVLPLLPPGRTWQALCSAESEMVLAPALA
ncbi:MAG: 2-phospho-L-lactate guanylyltransferase [Candidatus Dormibacteria bacterium]